MSAFAGPARVTNGLVFDIDMSNTKKSWIGAPTTNYIPNPYASWNGSSFVLGYNYQNLGATYTYRTGVDNPVNAPGVLEYYTGTSGYKYFSIDSTSLPSTANYTFSYYARLTGAPAGGNNAPIDSQLWRANGSDRSVTGDWNPTFTTEWKRYSTTGPAEASTILQYFPVHSGNIIGGYTIQYCGFQLEVGSYATPLAIGTRSSTQAIVDLTGRNTITASSVTYNSDNTFSFTKASGNYLTLPLLSSVNTNVSVSCWAYVTLGTSGTIFESGYGSGFAVGIGNNYLNANDPGNNIVGLFPVVRWISTGVSYGSTGWKNIVVTMDSSAIPSIYLNGSLVGTYPGTAPLTPVTNSYVGRNLGDEGSATDRAFDGKITAVSFYNKTLTANEILQNFNATRSRYGI
jgi:hypothetical protein